MRTFLSSSTRSGSSVRTEVVNACVVAAVVVASLIEAAESDDSLHPATVVGALVGCVALLVRRSFALPVLIVVVVVRIVVFGVTGSGLVMLPIVAVALYNIARYGDRGRGLAIASAAATVMAVASGVLGDDAFVIELLEEGAQMFLPIALGDALRTREDRVADMVEAEAEARVQAERLRIARDLHDVVAHGLSVIAIQSGVASRLLADDPAQAREALDAINATGRRSLEDLRSMVGALRSTDIDAEHPTPSDPDDLDDVIEPARLAGVAVTIERDGSFPADVGDATVVATHRILQEALMNVARHAGPVRATVRLDHDETRLRLTVENAAATVGGSAIPSTGVGIVGMRERAESVGGSLDAVPRADGGFRVDAVLPYDGRAS